MKNASLTPTGGYQRLTRKRVAVLCVLGVALLVASLADILIGASSLRPLEAIRIIFGGPSMTGRYSAIVWGIRLPMTLTCVCVGASLGLAGEQMQTILANPLASPFTLGISAAAGFGASLSIVAGFPFLPVAWLNTPISALLFSLLASAAIALSSSRRGMGDTKSMVLFGVVVTFFFQAFQSLMQYMGNQDQVSEIMHWLFGSLSKSTWVGVGVCGGVFLIVFFISIRFSWKLTALSAGEERAQSLGVNTERMRVQVFTLTAVLTAISVSYVGNIGFVGLVAPHFARVYVGEDQRYLAPVSAIFGVGMLLASSIIAKLVRPGVIIPVGIVTNMVGACFLAYLILRRKTS